MDKAGKNLFAAGILQLCLFTVFTFFVSRGFFALIDERFYRLTGYNRLFVTASDALGFVSIAFAAFFAVCGLAQLIHGKSIRSVDRRIIVIGFMYVAMFVLYVLFDKLALNVRPDGTEASYPSSHTMLFVCVNTTAIYMADCFVKKNAKVFKIAVLALTAAGVVLRLLSGCHWLSDIFGSLLLSSSLTTLFFALV